MFNLKNLFIKNKKDENRRKIIPIQEIIDGGKLKIDVHVSSNRYPSAAHLKIKIGNVYDDYPSYEFVFCHQRGECNNIGTSWDYTSPFVYVPRHVNPSNLERKDILQIKAGRLLSRSFDSKIWKIEDGILSCIVKIRNFDDENHLHVKYSVDLNNLEEKINAMDPKIPDAVYNFSLYDDDIQSLIKVELISAEEYESDPSWIDADEKREIEKAKMDERNRINVEERKIITKFLDKIISDTYNK